jgi:hypothetical protein
VVEVEVVVVVVVVIKGKEERKWKRQGKVGGYTLREVAIKGRSRGNNRRKEGGKVLAYQHRAIKAG